MNIFTGSVSLSLFHSAVQLAVWRVMQSRPVHGRACICACESVCLYACVSVHACVCVHVCIPVSMLQKRMHIHKYAGALARSRYTGGGWWGLGLVVRLWTRCRASPILRCQLSDFSAMVDILHSFAIHDYVCVWWVCMSVYLYVYDTHMRASMHAYTIMLCTTYGYIHT